MLIIHGTCAREHSQMEGDCGGGKRGESLSLGFATLGIPSTLAVKRRIQQLQVIRTIIV